MKPILKRILLVLLILGAGLAISKWTEEPVRVAAPPVVRAAPPPQVPALLPSRMSSPQDPTNSWERLLAADGTPVEDRAALEDIVTNYLQSARDDIRPPLGTNDEITRALMNRDTLGDSAIPASHPAIISGQLVDRWGSPWWFHPLSANVIEVRSAGPDRKLFTADDFSK